MTSRTIIFVTFLFAVVAFTTVAQQRFPSPREHDPSKYATVDYEAVPASLTAAQIAERKIKNKRYDVSLPVMRIPDWDDAGVGGADVEPDVPPVPYTESRLIVIGKVLTAEAFLSNEKKGIYTEFTIRVEKVVKPDGGIEINPGKVITTDRAGGVVRYPTGQKVFYNISGYGHPVVDGRYLFFLANDDPENPNYKILTGYGLADGKVYALNPMDSASKLIGMSEAELIKLVLEEGKEK